jgi:cobalt-zinc-cadmium efflux system outer membrane protein
MMQQLGRIGIRVLLTAVAAGGGCATVNPRPDYDRMADQVTAATGRPFSYRPDDDQVVQERVRELLRAGLTADDAAQVCLLNNRKVQAALYDIGAARADVVQAGLLSNPTLSFGLKFPDAGGLTKFEAALVENLADLWKIPLRRRATERALDQKILQVAGEASTAAYAAKTAYYRAKQADRKRDIATESVQLATQVLDLALARQQAGAGGEIDVNLARSEVQETELSLRSATLEAFQARSALAAQLSLAISPDALELIEALPEPPQWDVADDTLLRLAAEHRLDIRAAQSATKAARARVKEEQLKLFPTLELGVGFEREEQRPVEGRNILADSVRSSIAEGEPRVASAPQEKQSTNTLLGPSLGMELPIFNQNQGGIARAEYAYEQSLKLLEDLSIQAGQEVRLASARTRTAWSNVSFYRDQVLPLRETSLDLAKTAYQAGRTPLLNVLEAERALLTARAGYAESLQASASALIELEQATGQPIARILAAAQAMDEISGSGPTQPGLVNEPRN